MMADKKTRAGYKMLSPEQTYDLYEYVKANTERLKESKAALPAIAEGIGTTLGFRVPPSSLKRAFEKFGIAIPSPGKSRQNASNSDVERLRSDVALALARCGELKTANERLRRRVQHLEELADVATAGDDDDAVPVGGNGELFGK